ncbi:MAG: hypothetical protein CVV27_09490 [Candidatus Melainabacteria bacterium HGW-Melainabacteria-1]|nr:MAG: hypothetical protein CVV27_09490 [Candidatus Melainabacteria bacterium HGW-Melainabacteria-1]
MSDVLFREAQVLHRQGQLADAWSLYQQAAPGCHSSPGYWFWLGLLGWQIEQPDTACSCLQQAFALGLDLGVAWPDVDLGLQANALAMLKTLAPQLPAEPLAYGCDRLSLQLGPEQLTELWHWLLMTGRRQANDLEQLLRQRPWSLGWDLLATHYMRQGRSQQASTFWQHLIESDPDFAPAYLSLGHLALAAGDTDAALRLYQRALALQPLQPELNYHLGRLSLSLLEPDAAAVRFNLALQQAGSQSHPLWRVQQAMAYPPLLPSGLDASVLSERLLVNASVLRQQVALADCLPDLLRGGIEPCFDLNYLTEDDGPIRSAFADIFILPQLPRWREPSRRLSMGVLVTPGHEALFLFGSGILIYDLARAGIDMVLLIMPASLARFKVFIAESRLKVHLLKEDIDACAAEIQALELDLIYYWESGTDPLNYFLPMLQLAKVQFTGWGSVSTTGNPRMQYFLSAEALETPESHAHYRERLFLLPVLPMIYHQTMLPDSGRDRMALGLPPAWCDGLLLGCPHNPHKLTVEFLQALRDLLDAVPRAHLVLIQSRHPAWQPELANRVLAILGEQTSRVHWLPRLAADDFGALLKACDLLLDPFAFASGKLAFEALGLGVPLLTLPGRRLRGRITSACYQQMDYHALMASSPSDYVQKAIDLLQEPDGLLAHRQALIERKSVLMLNERVIPSVLAALAAMARNPL